MLLYEKTGSEGVAIVKTLLIGLEREKWQQED
jgi:hypothetical protein